MKSNRFFIFALAAILTAPLTGCGDVTDTGDFQIELKVGAGGSATASVDGKTVKKADQGDIVTVTATPNSGYTIDDWNVEGATFSSSDPLKITFTMPAKKVTVTVSFKSDENGGNQGGNQGGNDPNVGLRYISGTIEGFDKLPAGSYSLRLELHGREPVGGTLMATADVAADGSFRLDLSATPEDRYLRSFTEDGFPKTLVISDPNVRTVGAELHLRRDASPQQVYDIEYNSTKLIAGKGVESSLVFANAPVTITGYVLDEGDRNDDEEPETFRLDYDMSVAKGWNWVYFVGTDDGEGALGTTTVPAGFTMHFEVDDYSGYDPPQKESVR